MNSILRLVRPFLLLQLTMAPSRLISGPAETAQLRRTRLDIIYSSSLFRTVSKSEALAAIKVWVDTVGRQKGFLLDTSVSVADSPEEERKLIQTTPGALVLLDPTEYLELASLGSLQPIFTLAKGEKAGTQLLLVVNRESGVTALSGLRGKTLAIEAESRANLGRMWTESLLEENALGDPDRFFSSVSPVSGPTAAVLPVFFGKVGAGIVDFAKFEVVKEMNPQVGTRLRVLASSPRLLDSIVCVGKPRHEYVEDLEDALRNMDQTPAGRQILMLFRADRLSPIDRQALDRTRELWERYRRISGQSRSPRPAFSVGPERPEKALGQTSGKP